MPRLDRIRKIDAAPAPFESLRRNHYSVIVGDPPLRFKTFDNRTTVAARATKDKPEKVHYRTMSTPEILALPVGDLAAKDAVLLLWVSGVFLETGFRIIDAWKFRFKTVAFVWTKIDLTRPNPTPAIGQGFWTRSNAELCLLATRGHPKRLHADVSQIVLEPRRQHSRKPDIYDRIERLLPGPYVEIFARRTRPEWASWGDQTTLFDPPAAGVQQSEGVAK